MQGILVATVCLLLCFAGCAVPGQTETTSSGESHSAESTASLDDADFQQESAGFAPKDQMTSHLTVSTPIQEVIDDPFLEDTDDCFFQWMMVYERRYIG